jgi:hypothetical protein
VGNVDDGDAACAARAGCDANCCDALSRGLGGIRDEG